MINSNYYNERRYFTETEKDSDEYLISRVDLAIAELVTEKRHLKTAYNYYNGKMDAEEFKYIEDTYGIGNPTSLEFIPLVRKHVDALVGEHLGNKFKPKVTCKDKRTLDSIEKMKKEELSKLETNKLKNQFQSNLDYLIEQQTNPNAQPPKDEASEEALVKSKEDAANNFISEYELAAHFVIEDLKVNRRVDLTEKRRQLMLDLLVAGECGYKTEIVHEGELPKLIILDIKNLFYERNRNSPYLKDSPRVLYRRWMTRDQILNRWGHDIESNEDLKTLFDSTEYMNYGNADNAMYVSAPDAIGLQAGVGIAVDSYLDTMNDYRWNLIPVYEVEWVTTNKVKVDGNTIFRQDLYKGTRIGEKIYVDMGRDETVVRSIDNPYECTTHFNGVCYSDRDGRPHSMVLAAKNVQDKYNILHFHRDNLIANSGVKGGHVDVANLPTFLGENPLERLQKYIGYRKQGHSIINSAQETAANTPNTIYAGFDDSPSGQGIEAIQFAIQQTEEVCSGITGVFRERLGDIEQKDAVTNVEVGIKTSSVITKPYFHLMDCITKELMLDMVNKCKISFSKGKIGSILLGDNKQKIFTINPKYFCFTDYDIHIGDSSEIIKEIQEIKTISMELIKAGLADVDVVIDAITTESLTDMRDKVKASVAKKTEENGAANQLQQQIMQLQQQLQEVTKAAETLNQENEKLKQVDREFEREKFNKDIDIKRIVADSNANFNNQKLELDKKRIELEKLQLTDDNRDNDEVQNS